MSSRLERYASGAAIPVSQHYSDCFNYNLGMDAESPNYDSGVGPHIGPGSLPSGLTGDGTGHTRVRRISRFTKW